MMKNGKSKHYIKKILSFLTVACCLVGNMTPLSARAESGAASGENPRIVFTNEPVEEANLNVFKLVENADGGEVPEEEADTEFEFKLKLNGSAANQVIYHLYNGSVQEENEVFKEGGSTDRHKTKRDGTFYLKAGQIAVFRSEDNPLVMGENVKYSVTEEGTVLSEKAKSYNLLKSEKAEGSIKKNGATAVFTNEYIPNGTGNETRIDVVKTVPFAEGCKAPETPDFTFLLRLNNEACGNTPYDILNEDGDKTGEGKTDENGIFTLKGGQTARFTRYKGQKIKTGVQYEVMELDLPAGWRVAGDNGAPEGTVLEIGSEPDKVTHTVAASKTDSTIPITRVYFSNISASFGVSKFVEGSEKPDIDFTFELTHADRSAWPGASYYLYNGTGNLILNVADNAPENGSFSTDENGRFPLKHGQTAVFYGIAAGEKYNVREVRTVPGSPAPQDAGSQESGNENDKVIYVQSKPDDPAGYTNNTVTNTAPIWEFKNKPSAGGLTVTKAVTNLSGEAAFREVDFSFTLWERKELSDKDDEGNPQYEWKPVENEPFRRNEGGVEDEGTTKAGGSFTLKRDGTVVFPYLENGYYKVVEDLTGVQEYTAANTDKDSEGKDLTTQTVEGRYEAGSTVEFAFENFYEAWKFDLRLVKVDGEEKPLEGAVFKLYYLDPKEGVDSKQADHLQGTYTTEGNGIVTIGNLKAGTYIIEEAKAPSGYALLFEDIKVEIARTEKGISVMLDEGNADSDIVKVTGTRPSESNESDLVEITVYNTRLYELPSAGGRGIYWYLVGGILLMMAAALILYKYKFAGEVLKN